MDENVETIISNKVIGIIHSFQSEIIVLINRNTVETAYILFYRPALPVSAPADQLFCHL